MSRTGISHHLAGIPMPFRYPSNFVYLASTCGSSLLDLQPALRNARSLTRSSFRLFPVRSPLLRESR